MCKETL